MTINAAEVVGKENPFFVIGTYANANGGSRNGHQSGVSKKKQTKIELPYAQIHRSSAHTQRTFTSYHRGTCMPEF